MPETTLYFSKPGLLTTVQDMGRAGHQSYGVPIGGALDKTAMQAANWLVGNPLGHPVLEMTIIGPKIEMTGDCLIAFTGADMSPKINGSEAPLYEAIKIENNSTITFGRLKNGCRCYMAIAGDWQLKKWMGSYSAASINPQDLTPQSVIKKESVLKIKYKPNILKNKLNRKTTVPIFEKKPMRVLPGPEFDLFPRFFIGQFFSNNFKITADSNRMGYRLENKMECYENKLEIISSAVLPGTIQVTHSGQPIVLMADAQTTGGYPRLANVIEADMDYLAQLKPGDSIRFELVSLDEALHALVEKNNKGLPN